MMAQELWGRACEALGLSRDTAYEAWAFGDSPAALAELVLRGVKRATASLAELYDADGEPLPQVGGYSVLLADEDGEAVAVLRTTEVTLLPFGAVGEEQARAEGEGDGSLAYWRTVHERFFAEELAACGRTLTDDTEIVFERFEVVYTPNM